jgi:hypothetical protein
MATRNKWVHLFGTTEVPAAPVRIYLDVECLPDERFAYLIGMTVVGGGPETRQAFWADTRDLEPQIIREFLAEVGKYTRSPGLYPSSIGPLDQRPSSAPNTGLSSSATRSQHPNSRPGSPVGILGSGIDPAR